MIRPPPRSTLFPYTPLSRSGKHAMPLVPVEPEQAARDLVYRGLADALVVSGPATGRATPLADVKRVRDAVPDVPLLVGSGVTADRKSTRLNSSHLVISYAVF